MSQVDISGSVHTIIKKRLGTQGGLLRGFCGVFAREDMDASDRNERSYGDRVGYCSFCMGGSRVENPCLGGYCAVFARFLRARTRAQAIEAKGVTTTG
jgi:hypothetical protein